jgi:hypothetical protein
MPLHKYFLDTRRNQVHNALQALRMSMGQNCLKPLPEGAYQGKMTCECALR